MERSFEGRQSRVRLLKTARLANLGQFITKVVLATPSLPTRFRLGIILSNLDYSDLPMMQSILHSKRRNLPKALPGNIRLRHQAKDTKMACQVCNLKRIEICSTGNDEQPDQTISPYQRHAMRFPMGYGIRTISPRTFKRPPFRGNTLLSMYQ